jgi:hypothetical protein
MRAHGGLELAQVAGMEFDPLRGSWGLGQDMGVNYIAAFTKPGGKGAGAGGGLEEELEAAQGPTGRG